MGVDVEESDDESTIEEGADASETEAGIEDRRRDDPSDTASLLEELQESEEDEEEEDVEDVLG